MHACPQLTSLLHRVLPRESRAYNQHVSLHINYHDHDIPKHTCQKAHLLVILEPVKLRFGTNHSAFVVSQSPVVYNPLPHQLPLGVVFPSQPDTVMIFPGSLRLAPTFVIIVLLCPLPVSQCSCGSVLEKKNYYLKKLQLKHCVV